MANPQVEYAVDPVTGKKALIVPVKLSQQIRQNKKPVSGWLILAIVAGVVLMAGK